MKDTEAASRITAHFGEDGARVIVVFLPSLILFPCQYGSSLARIQSEDRKASHSHCKSHPRMKRNSLNRNGSRTVANRILFDSHNLEARQQNIRRRAVGCHIQPRFMPARSAASQEIADIGVIMLV